MKIDQDFLAWESLFLRLAAQWAFDEVLPSAALRHQVVLRLLDPEIRRGHDGKFARRILENALTRLKDAANSVSASQHFRDFNEARLLALLGTG